MGLILRLLLNTLAVIVTAYLLPGVRLSGFLAALVVAVVLGLINISLKPLLVLLTLPLTIITLGLFMLIINALMIMLASAIVQGFEVANFWWALLFSIVISIINSIFHKI